LIISYFALPWQCSKIEHETKFHEISSTIADDWGGKILHNLGKKAAVKISGGPGF
jgi:ribosomal protein S6E (S10)